MAIFGKNKNDKTNNDKEIAQNNTAAAPETAPKAEEKPIEKPAETPAQPSQITADVSAANNAPEIETVNVAQPQYKTPEGFDFNRYFLAERRIVLENVSYETQRPAQAQGGQYKLGVKDTIIAQLVGQAGVKVTYNRMLKFEPDGPFTLSVSFAVMLVFNPGTRGEIDWKTIDVADEFKKNCPVLVQTMMSKAALLVAEITASNGGAPVIALR